MVAYHEETPESESTEEEQDEVCLPEYSGRRLNSRKIELNVENQSLPFKIDTGTKVTAISAWKSLQNPPTLTKTTNNLCAPDRKPLRIIGKANVNLRAK